MSLDLTTLQRLRTYEDTDLGIRERFLKINVGGGSTIAVLSEPLENPRAPAFVLAHSFGLEQIALKSIETPIARRVSAAGFPVLRFHCQGYGDSELSVDQVSVHTHVRDTVDAISEVTDATGISQVGLMGARFGGSVAALVAERVNGVALALWHPVVSGEKYIRALMRQSTLSDIASYPSGRGLAPPDELEEKLKTQGVVDLQGFPVTREAFEAFRTMDLMHMEAFKGSSLVVQISATPRISSELEGFANRLRELGGECAFEVVIHARARVFGGARFRVEGGDHKIDTQADLLEDLANRTVEWCKALPKTQTTIDLEARR
jgi:pimeloyl-ACP methyl ester carboxylesterase